MSPLFVIVDPLSYLGGVYVISVTSYRFYFYNFFLNWMVNELNLPSKSHLK